MKVRGSVMAWWEDDVSEYQVLQVVTCFAGFEGDLFRGES